MTQSIPQGYKKRGVDVVGFWNPDKGPIHCIPRAAKLFDGNIDKSKPSTLLIVELVEACEAVFSKDEDDDAEQVPTAKGDVVGVWAKPGMAAIKTLAGEPTIIQYDRNPDGTVKTKAMKKKGMNAMKCFEVLSARNPMKPIRVLEDTRVESAHVNTLLAPAKRSRPESHPENVPSQTDIVLPDDDDVPF